VVWGGTVVHVATLGGRGSFEPVVRDGALVVGDGATGIFRLDGIVERRLESPREVPLFEGTFARLELANDVAYEVRVDEVEPPEVWPIFEPASLLSNGLSLLLHVAVIASLAVFVPTGDTLSAHRDRIVTIQRLLARADDPDAPRPKPRDDDMRDDSGHTEGGTGAVARGARGAMGQPTAAHANARFGVRGFTDNPAPETTRQAALEEAEHFGYLPMLETGAEIAPSTPWGRASVGNEERSAAGNLWGDAVAASFGASGLDLSGVGSGGGGRGEGIGVGEVGAIGHGLGRGIGGGVGAAHGHLQGGHTPGPPIIRSGSTTVPGRLPPEAIQRVVRQNFGRFRLCYQRGLRADPSLEGRVVVKFVIGRDGAVSAASDAGSDMAEPVRDCVVRRFLDLAFPQPENGVVTVVYPLVFTPSG